MILGVLKDVQDEMLKGESSGQIFAVVYIGQYVKLAFFLNEICVCFRSRNSSGTFIMLILTVHLHSV